MKGETVLLNWLESELSVEETRPTVFLLAFEMEGDEGGEGVCGGGTTHTPHQGRMTPPAASPPPPSPKNWNVKIVHACMLFPGEGLGSTEMTVLSRVTGEMGPAAREPGGSSCLQWPSHACVCAVRACVHVCVSMNMNAA